MLPINKMVVNRNSKGNLHFTAPWVKEVSSNFYIYKKKSVTGYNQVFMQK